MTRRNVAKRTMWKWAGVVFLIAAAAGGALYSMTARTASTSTGAALSPAAAGATAGGGSLYFIDPVTKESHAPSPEEIQALLASGGLSTLSVAEPEPIEGVNGTPGLRLTDEQMSFSVATRGANGKVAVEEAAGKTEAQEKVRAATAGGIKAGKEQNDVQ